MSHCLPSSPPKPAAPTFQIAASSKQTQLITGPSLAVGTPCFSRTAVVQNILAQVVGPRRRKVSGSQNFPGVQPQQITEYKVKGVIGELTSAGVGNNPAQEASRVIPSWTDI